MTKKRISKAHAGRTHQPIKVGMKFIPLNNFNTAITFVLIFNLILSPFALAERRHQEPLPTSKGLSVQSRSVVLHLLNSKTKKIEKKKIDLLEFRSGPN